ncbi:dimethylarginine dimethylaminohydrolase family protein [Paraburkholderia antibiotica]|uniref:Amidinotransferase n=1 Tax=Paraburkholderia antibiotica TaxID=2728839 RepID=A0A7Y0A0V3_9BURK|nr:amidinotransferase [Paraburkholderia antibiotica]NML34446.1 amidinotransferase [Paraburkholderia antibiotica]
MHFSQAIVRRPAASCASGLTTAQLGAPDYEKTLSQFDAYCAALRDLGLKLAELPAQSEFPDSHFVEDTAVVMPELAVITRPGAPARRGETDTIAPALAAFRELRPLAAGNMDGGDVLMVDKRFFIGVSGRTDAAGIRAFTDIVAPHGYTVDAIEVAGGLHLKSVVNYIGNNVLLLNEALADHEAFRDFERIVVDAEEEYAGNTLWINDTLITPQGYPLTLKRLESLGLPLIQLDTSEFRKMDGGLTCLSLRF